jgi:RNA polymerase sigma factor (sigma-70 family)
MTGLAFRDGHPASPRCDLSDALEKLVARYTGAIRAIGHRHGLSEGELDELVQEIRVRLWRARGSQLGGLNAAYVCRAAASAALDLIRGQRRRRELPLQSDPSASWAIDPHGRQAEDRAFRSDLVASVKSAVDQLVASRRAVVRMHLSGYGREEIAQLLGWSEAKTRNLLYRGLDDLRGRLRASGIER